MPSCEYDLTFLQVGVDILERYLLANNLYWQTGASAPAGEPPYPSLTLGALLLASKRLSGRGLLTPQASQLAALDQKVAVARTRWRAAWEKKAQREFNARLELWRIYLSEYRADPAAHARRYAYEVGRRVMLHLLLDEVPALPAEERQHLQALDLHLGQVFTPGDFIWEAVLAATFPSPPFWYLYGRLSETTL
ncbi:MAG: hypothetical protein L0Z70_00980 [Chloroflexi bacterium]|nr:hypothetical protein [Chloroflexota bacterium]